MLAVTLFITSIVLVYLLAALVVVRMLARRKIRPISLWDRMILLGAIAGLLCVGYGYFIERNWLSISHVGIHSPKIEGAKRPIRIAHFSDIHSESRPRLEPQLVQAAANEHPDVIVFTGDSINETAGLPVLRETMTALARIAPTFVVRGNWDTNNWPKVDLFGGTGTKELNGEAVRIEVEGTPLWIAGLAYNNPSALEKTVRRIPPGEFSVILYHTPDLMPEVIQEHVDLYCAGHTHGGQVALPFYGALITLSKFGKRYEAGLYHEKDTWLYVNRGVGTDGGFLPRVRFASRPELTVIDIRPDAE